MIVPDTLLIYPNHKFRNQATALWYTVLSFDNFPFREIVKYQKISYLPVGIWDLKSKDEFKQ